MRFELPFASVAPVAKALAKARMRPLRDFDCEFANGDSNAATAITALTPKAVTVLRSLLG